MRSGWKILARFISWLSSTQTRNALNRRVFVPISRLGLVIAPYLPAFLRRNRLALWLLIGFIFLLLFQLGRDFSLDDLKESKRDARRYHVELEETIVEGRRKEALPGWLREGIELEPTEEELAEAFREEGHFHEPSEPVIADEDDAGGRED